MIKVIFISNYLNFHQTGLWDAFSRYSDTRFTFLSTSLENYDKEIKPKEERAYNLFSQSMSNEMLSDLLKSCDVIILGACLDKRIFSMLPKKKMYFHNSEHFFRFISSPYHLVRRVGTMIKFKRRYKDLDLRILSLSSFVGREFNFFGMAKGKVYRFAYFPEVNFERKEIVDKDPFSILVCSRMLKLKNNHFALFALQEFLKTDSRYRLTYVGEGPDLDRIKKLTRKMGLSKHVTFHPFLPHEQVIRLMCHHQYFIFASNHSEGWGAVVNEAMSCGCVCLASSKAGATNYLVSDGTNSFVFSTLRTLKKVVKKVSSIGEQGIRRISESAFLTIKNVWNQELAALRLHDFIVYGENTINYNDSGPMSKEK